MLADRWIRGLGACCCAILMSQCAAPPVAVRMTASPAVVGYRDGKVMPYRVWPGNPVHPQAVLICVHGLSGAGQDFWPVGESFPREGYAVYGMQLRGQGNDPAVEARGDIRSAGQWRQDLLDFVLS